MKRFSIDEPCHVSVPSLGVRDLGGAVWSRRPLLWLHFWEAQTFLPLRGHLTFAMALHGAPRGVGTPSLLIPLWSYKLGLFFRSHHPWL